MSESNKTIITGDDGSSRQKFMAVELPSNTNKSKLAGATNKPVVERPKLDRVTTSDVIQKRKTFGSKVRDTLTGEDARSVGSYVVFDVIIPQVKGLLYDVFTQGLERSLFGSSSSRSAPRNSERTPYSRISTSRPVASDGRHIPRELSHRDRATHNFDEIIIESRAEAEMVLDSLTSLVETYGSARVSDLYDQVGITGKFTDEQWGWTTLRESGVRSVRGGWLLLMPQPSRIE